MATQAQKSVSAMFILKKETKGSRQYEEVDAKGNPIPYNDALSGAIYIRKSAAKEFGGRLPDAIEVTVRGISLKGK